MHIAQFTNSNKYTIKNLLPLIDFVIPKKARKANISIALSNAGNKLTTSKVKSNIKQILKGYSTSVYYCNEIYSSILIYTNSLSKKYPIIEFSLYRESETLLSSWEEDIIVTLSHEYRHVYQRLNKMKLNKKEAEIDAEGYAIRILNKFRKVGLPLPFPELHHTEKTFTTFK
jgi:hypothetical protein